MWLVKKMGYCGMWTKPESETERLNAVHLNAHIIKQVAVKLHTKRGSALPLADIRNVEHAV